MVFGLLLIAQMAHSVLSMALLIPRPPHHMIWSLAPYVAGLSPTASLSAGYPLPSDLPSHLVRPLLSLPVPSLMLHLNPA